MQTIILTAALAGTALLTTISADANPVPAGGVPVLTLTEQNDTTLDWSWSDGTGSGTFITASHDLWQGFSIPFPSGISDSFYGRWMEDFPGYRNDVYLPLNGPSLGTLYVSSDLVTPSGALAALGTALSSDHGAYQIIFNDKGDHIVTDAPDAGSTGLLIASCLGALALLRRSTPGARTA